jgi:assimilatory nitrate reductase catalytic subunit
MPEGAELAEYTDAPRGLTRIAAFRSGRLDGCIFVGPAHAPPQWDVVRSLFASGVLAERERRILLSGRSGDGMVETGPVICACFGVGLTAIREAIASGVAVSVDDIGLTLRAGTNCGSCVPELRGIIERMAQAVYWWPT